MLTKGLGKDHCFVWIKLAYEVVTESGTGTWDVGLGDSGTWGRGDAGTRDVGAWGRVHSGTWGLGDVGTRRRGDSGMWYARTSELGDARGFEDVINK